MKVNNLLIFVMLMVGFIVGMISLYMSSLSGIMAKMGLLGGDHSNSIEFNKLARDVGLIKSDIRCNTWEVVKHIPSYLFSKGNSRVDLSIELANERIVCGVRHVQDGNIERGVYTIIKGLYYLRSHYGELRILVEQDRTLCSRNVDIQYERWVESYLNASQGRVHDIVYDLYKQVESERARVDELCGD